MESKFSSFSVDLFSRKGLVYNEAVRKSQRVSHVYIMVVNLRRVQSPLSPIVSRYG